MRPSPTLSLSLSLSLSRSLALSLSLCLSLFPFLSLSFPSFSLVVCVTRSPLLAAPKAKLQNDHSRMPLIALVTTSPPPIYAANPGRTGHRVFCVPLGFLAGGLLACFATFGALYRVRGRDRCRGSPKKAAGGKRCGMQESTGEVSVQRCFFASSGSNTSRTCWPAKFDPTLPNQRTHARQEVCDDLPKQKN